MDGGIRWSNPANRAVHVSAQWEAKAFGAKPEPDLARRSQLCEFCEHGTNGADHGRVGIEAHFAVPFAPHKAHGQTAAQFTACCLVADAAIQPCAQDMKFRFRHGAFQSEDQSIVESCGMIDSVAVPDQSIRHAAQIEQAIPVGVVARQARDLQTQHDAYMAECHFRRHAGESGALHRSGAGQAEIFIDHDHLFSGPSQLAGPFHQSILPRR